MRERFYRFMQGRYGVDTLSKCMVWVALAAMLVSMLLGENRLAPMFSILSFAALIYCYFRMFSRNVSKRYAENQAFLAKTAGLRGAFARQMNVLRQLKTHHIYRCPGCKQKIRVPRGKGRIEIRCPKCSATFIKKS